MQELKRPELNGVLTELPVPFSSDGGLDYASLHKMIHFQIESGIVGIYLHGVGGETPFMTHGEEDGLIREAVSAAQGRIPIIANVISAGKEKAVERAKRYEAAGADMISISQPIFYTYSDDALEDYYSAVLDSVSVPCMVYNMPSAGYTLSASLIGRLFQDKRMIAYKDSTQNIMHLQSTIAKIGRPEVRILAGSDATFHSTLCSGGTGIVSMISMLFPREVIKLYNFFKAGDLPRAYEQQMFLLKVRSELKAAPLLAGYKAVARKMGLYACDSVRPPLTNITELETEALWERLKKLRITEES